MSQLYSRLAILIGTFSISACGPEKLEREQALEKIQRSEQVAKLPRVTTLVPRDGALERSCQDDESREALEKKGLLVSAMEKRGYYSYCSIALTPQGERVLGWKAVEQQRGMFLPAERYYEVPLFSRVPVEVTGIATNGDDESRALVEFTWRLEPTLSARIMAATTTDPEELGMADSLTKVRKRGTAQMRRYDDGWRVESVDVSK